MVVRFAFLISTALLLAACAPSGSDATVSSAKPAANDSTHSDEPASSSPRVPEVPEGDLSPRVAGAVERVLDGVLTPAWDAASVAELAELGDARVGWLLADLMRFYQTGEQSTELVVAFTQLTGAPRDSGEVSFVWATNHLITWDLPAWDGYPVAKQQIFGQIEPAWDRFFEEDHEVDWRLVTWGGVLADERPLGDDSPCNCIPALDYPETTDAAGGDWYEDDRIVFGVVVDDEAIALPKHQMEVHEMVNLTLGGRELGIPYCTLCASAQAYYVDDVPGVERVVLRTSGLLSRSNKLMYDLTTGSAIDTFTGRALTGSLGANGIVLGQVSVVASRWGDWKQAHPHTRILAEDGGIGRTYSDDPLRGRDDAGPIFPVGGVDPRLPVQELVVGVLTDDGTPIAFPVAAARERLVDGPIEYEGLTVQLRGGVRVYDSNGDEVVSHEAFWFAWSQFNPGTLIWDELGS